MLSHLANLANKLLARFVGGVRLAREKNHHRTIVIGDQALDALDIAEDHGGAFVGGKTARKANDQGVRTEEG